MAVEYKKFLAEYTAIETRINSAFGDRKIVGDSEGNAKKVLDGARLAIGDRIGELKAGGNTGTVLANFLKDAEVKTAYDAAQQVLANFNVMEGRKLKAHTAIKSIHTDMLDLKKRIDAEIASRKKKMFEPKSLPDMVKLSKEIGDTIATEGGLKDESIASIAQGSNPKPGALVEAFNAALALEVKKGAAIRANAAESELTAKFQPRLLKLRTDKVTKLTQEAESAAMAAMKAPDAETAKAQLAIAYAKQEEMNTIAEDFANAYNKNKSFLQQNPDHDVIFKAVSGMTALNNRVLKNIQTAQQKAPTQNAKK